MQQATVDLSQPPFFSQLSLPSSLAQYPKTAQLIYQEQTKRWGKIAADRWFANYIRTSDQADTRQTSIPLAFRDDLAKARWQETKDEQLGKVVGERCVGLAAICKAEDLIGQAWREKLGQAYPLVLLAVKSALEGGHTQGAASDGTYHFLSTLPSLGVLCAAITQRDAAFNERTLRRWLSPNAPHALALRCWLGWRTWYTDTLLEFRKGQDTNTKKEFATGSSRGPVIGGTLFRLRLTPCETLKADDLATCTKERPSLLQPLASAFRNAWRNLDIDRQTKRTWQGKTSVKQVADFDVRIDEVSTNTLSKGLVYLDLCNTPCVTDVTQVNKNYLYPDTHTLAGAKKLTHDVNKTAEQLLEQIEGKINATKHDKLINRYRHAVWVAVRMKLCNGLDNGFELLEHGTHLAQSIRKNRTEHASIKNIGAYTWSKLEKQGFTEFRRDYSFKPGRYQRIMPKALTTQVIEGNKCAQPARNQTKQTSYGLSA